jgi:hypothetical protein
MQGHTARRFSPPKSVWASDYRFLSDTSEFEYALSIFQKIFAFAREELPSDAAGVIESLIKDHFAAPDFPFNLLIASFCEDDDLLSQWRGYNGAIGYAIGFNVDWLQQNVDAQGFKLVQACYKAEKQEQTIVDAFNSSTGAKTSGKGHDSRAAPAKSTNRLALSKVSHGRKRHMPDL